MNTTKTTQTFPGAGHELRRLCHTGGKDTEPSAGCFTMLR